MQLRAKIIGKQRLPVEDMPELGSPPYGVDPWQYAVPPEYVPPEYGMDPQILADEARASLNEMPTQKQLDPKNVPENLPASPAASGKTKTASAELSPETQLSDEQLLRNYLLSLQKRRDNEGELRAMNETALGRGRVAMLAEGLSESASKMGNILGTPTGSTMQGFGKEAANLEMTGVDQARKIMEGTDPTVELARQAQIATMLEQIRTSRGKAAEAEADRQVKREQIESQERQNRLRVEAQKQKDKKPPKLTEGEMKAADYGKRMNNAEKDMDAVIGKNYDPSTVGAALRRTDLPIVGEYFANPLDRQYLAAAREWVAALLRKDSGAAVTDEEFRNAYRTYFPMPGDDAETMRQKKERRLKQQKTFLEQGKVDAATLESSNPAQGAEAQPSPAQAPTQGNKMRGALLKKYKSQGKVLMKDTMTGEYVAVKKSELQKYKTIPNPKHANQPRYMEVTE